MSFYIILYAAVVAIAVPCYLPQMLPKKYKDILYLLISGGILSFFSGTRYDIGTDYSNVYLPEFEKICESPITDIFSIPHEIGYVFLEYCVAFFTQNFVAIFVTTSIMIVMSYFGAFYKYSKNVVVCVALYLLWGNYFCSFNFVRQMIASGIFLFAFQSIIEKKPVRYVFLTLLAASFHKTALVMLPFYFILQIPLKKKILAAYSGAMVVVYLMSDVIIRFLSKVFFPGYIYSEDRFITVGRPWRVAFMALVLVVVFYISSSRLKKNNSRNGIYVSCALFNFFIYVISTKHMVLDRFVMYFEPSLLIGLTIILEDFVSKIKKAKEENKLQENVLLKKKLAALCIPVIMVSVYECSLFLYYDGHRVIPYQSIYQQDFYSYYKQSLEDDSEVFAGEYDEDIVEPIMLPED